MFNALFRKLEHLSDLPGRDRQLIEACDWRVERYGANVEIVQEGSDPRYVNVVIEGWACRVKQLEDGRRQIIALFVPGDMCDPCVFLLDQMSHALTTLTPTTIARLPERDVIGLIGESETVSKAFWLEMLVSAEVQREWTVSLGRRTSIERMAHLFCELLLRLRAVGLADAEGCNMPITQADLADVLGLSAVHVNRTLQEIRAMKLVEVRGKRLSVLNEKGLQALALFNPSYLHMRPLML